MSTWWEFLVLTSDLQSMVHKDLWGTYNYWTATLCCIYTVNHSSFARFPKCHCVWLDGRKLSPCHGRRCDYRGRATEQWNCPSWSWRLGNFKLDREQWKESDIQHQMRQLDNHACLLFVLCPMHQHHLCVLFTVILFLQFCKWLASYTRCSFCYSLRCMVYISLMRRIKHSLTELNWENNTRKHNDR